MEVPDVADSSTPNLSGMQHNKRRAELHRLQTKHPELAARMERQAGNDDETESSSSEEEVRCATACIIHTAPLRHHGAAVVCIDALIMTALNQVATERANDVLWIPLQEQLQ